MAAFRPGLQTCPCCGARGTCRVHAYYGRSILDFINGKPVRHDVCVMRLICDCGHTHAVLPDFIVPYRSYGLFFILRVLMEYFLRLSTVEGLCERFGVSISQFRRWLGLFKVQKEQWLGVLSSLETPALSFLKSMVTLAAYSDFASSFVRRFARSFLQSHQNPAAYCRQAFGP